MKFKAKIHSKKFLTKETLELTFQTKQEFNFLAGQFLTLVFELENKEKVRRSYSICSNPNNKFEFKLCIKEKKENGFFTKLLFEEKLDKIEFDVLGPLGLNNSSKFNKEKLILIAFGSGIAPIKSVIEKFKNEKEIILFYQNRFEDEIIYKNEFELLEKELKNFNVKNFLSSEKNYINLENENLENSDIFICGRTKAVEKYVNIIKEMDLKNINLLEEKFG
jgi:NAD(P)H-flavin reductase